MMLKKIISGGQTGVDQAALKAAIDFGMDHGGWCPPGRLCETGRIPNQYRLTETQQERSPNAPDIPRSLRTEWNVRDSDATFILIPNDFSIDMGSSWTIDCAQTQDKPIKIIDPWDLSTIPIAVDWLAEKNIETLNVAGPSELSYEGIFDQSFIWVISMLKSIEKGSS